MKLSILVGNGRKIGILVLPFLVIGVVLNIIYPNIFSVGGPSKALAICSIIFLVPGVIIWVWSVILIITKIPKKKLITSGPYRITKHPLYNGVALLVIPWFGFLINTWLGVIIGMVIYIGSRLYSPEEETILVKLFGDSYNEYSKRVLLPWL